MSASDRTLSVIVISLGRPDCLRDMMRSLNAQTRKPDRVLFVVTSSADVPQDLDAGITLGLDVIPEVIVTTKGTCHQRNIGLDALDQNDGFVIFFDDDYVPAANALEAIETGFDTFGPDIAGMSGHLIADGIAGPGISFDQANAMIHEHHINEPADFLSDNRFAILRQTIGLYGCNMAFHFDVIGDTRFDEYLPLYAWQEDVDFAHRVALHAGKRMILTDVFSGVHRGVKNGRENRGARLGYSQVANNWYLWKNNHLPGQFALRVAARNILANHARLIKSEPWIDRRGRAYGNWLALRDIVLGRVDPQRVHEI